MLKISQLNVLAQKLVSIWITLRPAALMDLVCGEAGLDLT